MLYVCFCLRLSKFVLVGLSFVVFSVYLCNLIMGMLFLGVVMAEEKEEVTNAVTKV